MKQTLVLYVFHIFNHRVDHFIKNCIFEDDNIDFIIISNDKHTPISVPSYVKVLYRDNKGYDFGGWSEALLTQNLYKNYETFIFVNSSVSGPFIPSYCRLRWTDIFLNGLQEDNVQLFGATINTITNPLQYAHVQSYIFAMNQKTLQILIDKEIFSMTNYFTSFEETIWNKEILMSKIIIQNKGNIACLFDHYRGVDFTFRKKPFQEYPSNFFLDDVMLKQHENILWNKYQLIFVKGNRLGY